MSTLFFVAALAAVSIMATSVAARPGQGYQRDFSNHARGNPCQHFFTNHPYLDQVNEWKVQKTFVADASYYGNQFHNRNPMASGNKLHECDATVVAFNSLPLGTVIRATYPVTGQTAYLVVQDTGGKHVYNRPDLARGAFEKLAGRPADGVLKRVVYEVLKPAK